MDKESFARSLYSLSGATTAVAADISKGCDVMVTCPARLQYWISCKVIDVTATYALVLDGASKYRDSQSVSRVFATCPVAMITIAHA